MSLNQLLLAVDVGLQLKACMAIFRMYETRKMTRLHKRPIGGAGGHVIPLFNNSVGKIQLFKETSNAVFILFR